MAEEGCLVVIREGLREGGDGGACESEEEAHRAGTLGVFTYPGVYR